MKFRFKSFKVYQDSKKFCKFCRDIVEKHIKKKDKELASQVEKALNSIVLNIAEGSADNSDAEFARFLGISIRSVYETVAGFDLALLYEMIVEDENEKIESDAYALVDRFQINVSTTFVAATFRLRHFRRLKPAATVYGL